MLPYATIFTVMGAHKALVLAEGVRQAQALAAGTKPTIEQVKLATFGYAKTVAEGWLLPDLTTALQKGVASYVSAHGPRPATDKNDPLNVSWCDGFDEYLMDAIGTDTLRGLGQDFIGQYLTDSEMDENTVLTSAAEQGAKLLVEAAVHAGQKEGRSPGQVLAEVGIVHEDLAAHALPGGAPEAVVAAEPVIDEVTARVRVEQIIGRWAIGVGVAALDPAAMAANFKPMFDDEHFLVLGPIQTIGGKTEDVPYFMAYFKAHGAACVDQSVAAAFNAALTGEVVTDAKPVKPAGGKAKKTKAQAVPPPVSVAEPGTDHSAIIKLLREHRLRTDEDLGNIMGVSRAQVANIATKGKAVTLTPKIRAALLAAVDERLAGLSTARQSLA